MKRRPRGSGTIRKEGSGWAIIYGPRKAPTYEGGFRTKVEAERRLTILRAEAMQRRLGVAADPRLTPTLEALAGPWLERRKITNPGSAQMELSRWRIHLGPALGHLRPDEVDTARLRAFIEGRVGVIAPGTIRVVISVLSSLYQDLLERGLASRNPCHSLPDSIHRLMASDHISEDTPFIEKLDDVRRIFLALDEPLNVAYAIGALAGLRTGEVFALKWRSVDLDARQFLVSESTTGRTKDRDPRPVPIQDALLPVLKSWRLRHPGPGLVIPVRSHRAGAKAFDRDDAGPALRKVLADLGLARPGLGLPPDNDYDWYRATRHTFASQWAMAGRPMRELQKVLGHSSIAMTERYAHLAPGYWAPGVHAALAVDLSAGGSVAQLSVDGATPTQPTTRNHKRSS